MKSDDIKKDLEELIKKYNQLIDEEKRLGNMKQQMLMEISKLQGMHQAYQEIESEVKPDTKEVKKNESKK